jgi:hypothetical protein
LLDKSALEPQKYGGKVMNKKAKDKTRAFCSLLLAGILAMGANTAVAGEVDGKGNPVPGGAKEKSMARATLSRGARRENLNVPIRANRTMRPRMKGSSGVTEFNPGGKSPRC